MRLRRRGKPPNTMPSPAYYRALLERAFPGKLIDTAAMKLVKETQLKEATRAAHVS